MYVLFKITWNSNQTTNDVQYYFLELEIWYSSGKLGKKNKNNLGRKCSKKKHFLSSIFVYFQWNAISGKTEFYLGIFFPANKFFSNIS